MTISLLLVVATIYHFWAAAGLLHPAGVHNRLIQTNQTITDILANDENLNAFYSAVEVAGFADDILKDSTVNVTLFAPTVDNLFHEVGQLEDSRFLTDSSWILHLRNIISLHFVIKERILASQLSQSSNLVMHNGEEVQVLETASDGIVLSSSNTAKAVVLETDILCANGVIHKIDTSLLPKWYDSDLYSLATDFVKSWHNISISLGFVYLAGQSGFSIFQYTAAITVLFPLDSAWLELEPEILAFYRDPKNHEARHKLLKGHIITTLYPSVSAKDGDTLTTFAGTQLSISVLPNGTVMFDDALMDSQRDFLAKDGLLHAINKVLLPLETVPTAVPTSAPPLVTNSPTKSPLNAPTSIDTNNDNKRRSLSRGAIAGLSVSILLVLVFIAVFAARQMWSDKRKSPSTPAPAIMIEAVAITPGEEAAPMSPARDGATTQPQILEVLPPANEA